MYFTQRTTDKMLHFETSTSKYSKGMQRIKHKKSIKKEVKNN